MSTFRPFNLLIAALAVSLVAALPAAAQEAAISPDLTTAVITAPVVETPTATVQFGPVVRNTTLGARAVQPTTEPELARLQNDGPNNKNVTWMIVGGAGLIVGSMIGGDAGTIVMVTFGVIGLLGLYRYLS